MSTWHLIDDTIDGIPDLMPMVRSPGNHVSTGVRRRAIRRGDFLEGDAGDFDKPVVKNRVAIGSAIERGLVNALCESQPQRYFAGWELQLDNISGTHDFIDIIDRVVWETKATWMSAKRELGEDPKLDKFAEQICSYVHMMSDGALLDRIQSLRDSITGPRSISDCSDELDIKQWSYNQRTSALADRLECATYRVLEDNNGGGVAPWTTAGVWIIYLNGYNKFWLNLLSRGRYTSQEVDDDGPLSRKYLRVYTKPELISNWTRVLHATREE